MEKYYAILGLMPGASKADIKKAYRKLAMRWHPDKNPDNADAERKFREISEAYQMLTNPSKASGRTGAGGETQGGDWFSRTWKKRNQNTYTQDGFNGADFRKMCNDLFGERQKKYKQGFTVGSEEFDFDRKNYGGRAVEAVDIYADFARDITQMLTGTELGATVHRKIICAVCGGKPLVCDACGPARNNKCSKCGGSGIMKCEICEGAGYTLLKKDVRISVNATQTPITLNLGDNRKWYALLRFKGMGHQGRDFGGVIISGDLYFRITIDMLGINMTAVYGGKLVHEVEVTLAEALAGPVRVKCARGETHEIKMDYALADGRAEYEIPGGGFKPSISEGPGEYVFSFKIKMPDFSKLSAADRKTLAEMISKL
jgi:molecular chaperone DnaJ